MCMKLHELTVKRVPGMDCMICIICMDASAGRGRVSGDVYGRGHPHLRQPVQPVPGAQHFQHRRQQHAGTDGPHRSGNRR